MRNILLIILCLFMMFFIGKQLVAQEFISSVDSYNSIDPADNDENYPVSARIVIVARALDNNSELNGTISITSALTRYNSNVKNMENAGSGTYQYTWDTTNLSPSTDYKVSITLSDNEGNQDKDETLVIVLDSLAPVIASVISRDKTDVADNDNIYHAGQTIVIDIQELNKTIGLDATIQIKSNSVPYDSGIQKMIDQKDGTYRYTWTTTGLNEAKDYKATFILKDKFEKQSQDSSLTITIDNKPPQNINVLINNDDEYTLSNSVNLAISAENATKMYIFGDVVDDVNTLDWVKYAPTLEIKLSGKDGTKKVSVKFTNEAGNESSVVEDSIILDEMPPVIESVFSSDEADKEDNDNIYHSGQPIIITAQVDTSDLVKLEGSIQIVSAKAKYDSGLQILKDVSAGTFTYRWDTTGLLEASDYLVTIKFIDPSNREVIDKNLRITIDNLPPTEGKITINNGEAETDSRSVILTLSARNEPREMFIDGDIIKDTNTFSWIRYATQMVVNLTDGDGKKQVNVKFIDAAKNESAMSTANVMLDRNAPTSTSIIIQDGAKYTTARDVTLKLKAVNAEQMFIDGDVVDDATTFGYVGYREQVSVKLTPGDGEKKIGVIFRNKLGIQSDRIQAIIILDTTTPVIFSVSSQDLNDSNDNDGIYRPGQAIAVSAILKTGEANLSGIIQIQSQTAGYDSNEQKMDGNNQEFRYIWDTASLEDANDYVVRVEFADAVGLKTENSNLIITLDSSPPPPGDIIINNAEKTTETISVRLDISATDAIEMLIDGNIINDSNTFEWIPYKPKLVVNLSGSDGEKNISVKFRDSAGNESSAITASITLNRNTPYDTKLNIANTSENAKSGKSDKFATTRKVFLGLSAQNASHVYISGDIATAFNTFRWIAYSSPIELNLTKGDGNKSITVKFRNLRLIESDPIQGNIVLDITPPQILSASVESTTDPNDRDGWYHSGESLRIIAEVIEANNPQGLIRIKSDSIGYDSGILNIATRTQISQDRWRFEYIWDTKEIDKENDYFAEISLTDEAGWTKTSDPVVIHIDNMAPYNVKAVVNKGGIRTSSRSVSLEASAEDASEILVSGDVIEDTNTLKWVPLKTTMTVRLTAGEGEKKIQVKMRDRAKNETDTTTATVILSQSPPIIERVDSWNTADLSNDDEKYHAGELIELALKAQTIENAPKSETALLADVSIVSADGAYKSGIQKALEEEGGWYTYVWDTKELKEGDYNITWNLSDGVGHSVSDNSLHIIIDNTPPQNPVIGIDTKAERTKSRSVNLSLSAEEASWVFIDGDVLQDKGLTFEWVRFSKILSIRLTDGDGLKLIRARFKDNADNTTEIVTAQITLDTVGPGAISIKINDNDEYTSSTEIKLTVAAEEATRMYIDGDLSDDANVRNWIPYQKEMTGLNLSGDDGQKNVSIKFQDEIGNISKEIADSIILDNTPPNIKSVKSQNVANSSDNDGKYLKGTSVNIVIDAEETKLSANIQISSSTTGFDSGIQKMTELDNGTYGYVWDTNFLQNAEDYIANIEIKDNAGNKSTDSSLTIIIFDKQIEPKVTINDDDEITTFQSVLVKFTADNASEMNISGDVVDNKDTFEWINFAESKKLSLTSGDGIKNIKVIFRDSQSIEIGESSDSIVFDQTPPAILSIKTSQKSYKAGSSVEIVLKARDQETGLDGTIQVSSFSTGYDSGIQKASEGLTGDYIYLWDTTGLKEGDDYRIEAILSDKAKWKAKDNNTIITIDNTAPKGGSFTINGNAKYTNKRSVRLNIVSAEEASEMLIEGNIISDSNTFQWIPIRNEMVVNLAMPDGEKKLTIIFRDKVGNMSESIEQSIVLNELPPVINSVISWDEGDSDDNDKIYHAGQPIKIAISFDNVEGIDAGDTPSQLQAWVQIISEKASYDSGLLIATLEDPSAFTVVWKTDALAESSDYVVKAILKDGFNQEAVDESLIITIDNALPTISDFTINKGKSISNSQIVALNISADGAKEMHISGDVVESANTFRWIPFAETRQVRLSKDNGEKNIAIKLRDSANNVTDPITASIVLDRSIPDSPSITINDGIKSTDSYKVALDLSANSGREMYISGDVVQDENTFKWIPYVKELSVRLTNPEGNKTIFARFRNGVDNESEEVNAQILLDITAPGIGKIEAFDISDNTDNDLSFHSGQMIVLKVTALRDEPGLQGTTRIQNAGESSPKYDSGQQTMNDEGFGVYTFIWDTTGIEEGVYSCEVILKDSVAHSVSGKTEIVINNQKPYNPKIAINTEEAFVYSRTIEISLSVEGPASEVFISGDVISDDTTLKWIPFSPDDEGNMKTNVNLRGNDGKKEIKAVFRSKYRSESTLAEVSTSLELKRPELVGSCRIIQTSEEPVQAYLTLQFDEPISRADLANFFLTLRDKMNLQNFIEISGVGSELILSNDLAMLEIPEKQLNEIKQWQPLTLFSSYIQAEIVENSVFDMSDKGNLGNKQKPADVYFAVLSSTMDVTVEPSSISPNDDDIKDKATILYVMVQDSEVIIKIRNSQLETIKEWHIENQPGGVVYPLEWTGKKPDGTSYPEGSYTVIVMSKVLEASGFAYGVKRNVTIDNTPPQISDIYPWEGSRVSVLLQASVKVKDMPASSKIESVYITIDNDIENRIPLAKSKVENEYVVPSTYQLLLPTGKHSINFHAVDAAGNESEKSVNYTFVAETGAILDLMNFPNPFPPGGTTTIRYSLPEKGQSGEILIYDAGHDVLFLKELSGEELESGEHAFQWDGRDTFGRIMARGIYFCQLSINTSAGNKSKLFKIAIR